MPSGTPRVLKDSSWPPVTTIMAKSTMTMGEAMSQEHQLYVAPGHRLVPPEVPSCAPFVPVPGLIVPVPFVPEPAPDEGDALCEPPVVPCASVPPCAPLAVLPPAPFAPFAGSSGWLASAGSPGRFLFSGLAVGDLLLVFRDEAVGGFQRIHLDALLAQAIGGARLQVV